MPYRPREFVVLEAPSPQNWSDEDSATDGRSTADIIAQQSQDYVDEKLAEYQATIYMLQGNSFIFLNKKFIQLVMILQKKKRFRVFDKSLFSMLSNHF